ncbi:hypothetical protein GIB67_011912 [Kingdonia uniflora]|uniref:Transposase-associated domain-containing protein n=1 Tax=Kingdonia uniflora TaxID=39325 RepID=A0A7J7LZV2_9MAGN|nr:hypothetical protein GIB67_011912 [Kingdonia uniflora]
MDENRKSKGYSDGVNLLIQFVKDNYRDPSFCPCKKCRNVNGLKSLKNIRYHLFLNGIDQSYTTWYFHGEVNDEIDNTDIEDLGVSSSIPLNDVGQTRMFDLVNDALGHAPFKGLNDYTDNVRSNSKVPEEDTAYKNLREDASRLIYPMCSPQDTKLSVTIELMSLKTDGQWIMRTYKESVRSPRHVEACIMNSYILDEAILYCMEYIPNSRRGSYKQGKPLFMDDDADDKQPMDKKGKNITLENLKFEQVRKWVLSCFDGIEEWEEMSISSSISSGRCSMPSDQIGDSSNLVPQRASTSPGLLRKRKALTLNEVGQAVGDNSTKFSTRIGEIAREHIPIYIPTWKGVSNDTKMLIWNSLSNEYELPLAAKDQVLIGANIAYKKCELRKVYDKYPTEDARKINCPTTTIQDDWELFVNLSSDPKVVAMRARNKVNRSKMLSPSTTGRTGIYRLAHYMLHPLFEFAGRNQIEREKNPESKHYDVDDGPVGQAYGPEKKGRVRGEGILATKSMLKHMKHARTIIKEGKLAYKEINNKLNVVIDEVKTLKENATREGQRMQNASPYHTLEHLIGLGHVSMSLRKIVRMLGMQQIDVMRSYIAQVNITARDAQVKGTYRQIQRFQKKDGKNAFQKMDGKVIYPEVDIREAQRYLKEMKVALQIASNSDSKITVSPYSRESSIHKMPSSFPPNQDALSDTPGYCQNCPSLHQPAGSYPSSQQRRPVKHHTLPMRRQGKLQIWRRCKTKCKYGEGAKQKADDAYTSAKDTMSGKAETNYEAPKVTIVWYFGMPIQS